MPGRPSYYIAFLPAMCLAEFLFIFTASSDHQIQMLAPKNAFVLQVYGFLYGFIDL